MNERSPEVAEAAWTVEEFYFGLHEWVTYRRQGERVQAKIEQNIPLVAEVDDGSRTQYLSGVEGVAQFLAEHEDCAFRVGDSYELVSGGTEPPALWVEGWKDISQDFRAEYERHREWALRNGQIKE